MSVRKRKWITRSGEAKEAWIVDYVDQQGGRHIETFDRKKDADEYHATVKVDVRTGTHTPVSKSITVAQAAEDWITSIKLEGPRGLDARAVPPARAPHRRAHRQPEARQPHHAARSTPSVTTCWRPCRARWRAR